MYGTNCTRSCAKRSARALNQELPTIRLLRVITFSRPELSWVPGLMAHVHTHCGLAFKFRPTFSPTLRSADPAAPLCVLFTLPSPAGDCISGSGPCEGGKDAGTRRLIADVHTTYTAP